MRSFVTGKESIENSVSALIEKVKNAKNVFQLEQAVKEYKSLRKSIDKAVGEKGGGEGKGGLLSGLGSIFGKGTGGDGNSKSRSSKYDLIDEADEAIEPLLALLDGFSKGTLLLADKREKFFKPLSDHRQNRFSEININDSKKLSAALYSFYINVSNAVGSSTREREELKKIIASLTKHIQQLAISSKNLDSTLVVSSKKIEEATSLAEIQMVQKAILVETDAISKSNALVRKKLVESHKKMKAASSRIATLERELEAAREEKWTDHLTGLYNRGYFDERLAETVTAFKRNGEPVALLIFDIDHFKKFNDTYGHQVGDKVLQVVAGIAKESVRASDTIARYGGEEFVAILYGTKLSSAAKVAEVLRLAVANHELGIRGKTVKVYTSVGVAALHEGDSSASLVKRADEGLYKAKEEGRNRVVVMK
jgi:diguanylate cyclase